MIDASRAAGNALFASRRYSEAASEYERAGVVSNEALVSSLLFSNASACHLALGKGREALDCAERAVRMDSGNGKAWYRVAKARMMCSQPAVEAATRAVRLSPRSKEAREVLRRARRVPRRGLYDDVPDSEAERAVWRLKEGRCWEESCFETLMDPEAFRAAVFPGYSNPPKKSLADFLNDPEYARATEACWPVARERAKTVLENVKRRAPMDGETERELWPQILRESMARELSRAARKVILLKRPVETTKTLQFPYLVARIDNFLGEGWSRAMADDAARHPFANAEHADFAWIDSSDDENFPALAELENKLDALDTSSLTPVMVSSHDRPALKARMPAPQQPLLERLCQSHRPLHFSTDSGTEELPVGRTPALSFLYFLPRGDPLAHLRAAEEHHRSMSDNSHQRRGGGGGVAFRCAVDDMEVTEEANPDTLFVWRSDCVQHRRIEYHREGAKEEDCVLSVRHWMFT